MHQVQSAWLELIVTPSFSCSECIRLPARPITFCYQIELCLAVHGHTSQETCSAVHQRQRNDSVTVNATLSSFREEIVTKIVGILPSLEEKSLGRRSERALCATQLR